MRLSSWLRVLGQQWTTCDNISEYQDELCEIIGYNGREDRMMTAKERHAYQQLPEAVSIYRGCGEHISGMSWSLHRDAAELFPFLARYRTTEPVLVIATVQKADIIAVKLDRNEQEVITFWPEIVSTKPIPSERGETLLRRHQAQCLAELNRLCVKSKCQSD